MKRPLQESKCFGSAISPLKAQTPCIVLVNMNMSGCCGQTKVLHCSRREKVVIHSKKWKPINSQSTGRGQWQGTTGAYFPTSSSLQLLAEHGSCRGIESHRFNSKLKLTSPVTEHILSKIHRNKNNPDQESNSSKQKRILGKVYIN